MSKKSLVTVKKCVLVRGLTYPRSRSSAFLLRSDTGHWFRCQAAWGSGAMGETGPAWHSSSPQACTPACWQRSAWPPCKKQESGRSQKKSFFSIFLPLIFDYITCHPLDYVKHILTKICVAKIKDKLKDMDISLNNICFLGVQLVANTSNLNISKDIWKIVLLLSYYKNLGSQMDCLIRVYLPKHGRFASFIL